MGSPVVAPVIGRSVVTNSLGIKVVGGNQPRVERFPRYRDWSAKILGQELEDERLNYQITPSRTVSCRRGDPPKNLRVRDRVSSEGFIACAALGMWRSGCG